MTISKFFHKPHKKQRALKVLLTHLKTKQTLQSIRGKRYSPRPAWQLSQSAMALIGTPAVRIPEQTLEEPDRTRGHGATTLRVKEDVEDVSYELGNGG
ncbi:hypothetical protein TNCV_2516271 [Trichonephila clavipes]|nr:hypothetical protein TNCV_2516271 [Trichonephila clavipes]